MKAAGSRDASLSGLAYPFLVSCTLASPMHVQTSIAVPSFKDLLSEAFFLKVWNTLLSSTNCMLPICQVIPILFLSIPRIKTFCLCLQESANFLLTLILYLSEHK